MRDVIKLFVRDNSKAIEAIKVINKTEAYIALVVDKEKKLLDCIKSNTFFAINEKNCATKDTINPTIKAVTTKARFDLSILK